MVRQELVTLLNLASATTTQSGGSIDGRNMRDYAAELVATLVSGASPSLTVVLEDSSDGTNFGTWFSFTTTAATATERVVAPRPPMGKAVRATISGIAATRDVKVTLAGYQAT